MQSLMIYTTSVHYVNSKIGTDKVGGTYAKRTTLKWQCEKKKLEILHILNIFSVID